MKKYSRSLVSATLTLLLAGSALAEDTPVTDGTTTEFTTIGTSVNTEGKLTQQYAEFFGGEEPAAQAVDGLRQGTSFSLASEIIPETTDTVALDNTVIEPPTGTMGYGNVKMTLSLAEAKLAEMGITQPTSEQLSAVLLGGDIDGQVVDGILVMRADGMGWGEIARQYDMKVGQLMGKKPVITTSTAPVSTANSNGYIPSGSAKKTVVHSNGYIPSSKGQGHGKGIISASGATVHSSGHMKQNGKVKVGGNMKTHVANKHGYIPASASNGTSSGVSNAATSHGSMGKAKGHANKK